MKEITQEEIDNAMKSWLIDAGVDLHSDTAAMFMEGWDEGVKWVLKQIKDL